MPQTQTTLTDGGWPNDNDPDAAADPSVFEDTDRHSITITESDLLGTHTYENVLYTGPEAHGLVDVTTGDTPADLDRTTEEAQQFADRVTDDDRPDRVAKRLPPEQAAESRSPYVASAFFHCDITGGMDWHTVYRKACDSDAYNVSYDADYNTGDLTITVTRTA